MAKGGNCHYCNRRMLDSGKDRGGHLLAATRDHITPKCKGGRSTVWACRQCNQLKADMSPERWHQAMTLFPRWWKAFRTHHELRDALRVAVRPSLGIPRHRAPPRFPFRIALPPLCRGLA